MKSGELLNVPLMKQLWNLNPFPRWRFNPYWCSEKQSIPVDSIIAILEKIGEDECDFKSINSSSSAPATTSVPKAEASVQTAAPVVNMKATASSSSNDGSKKHLL